MPDLLSALPPSGRPGAVGDRLFRLFVERSPDAIVISRSTALLYVNQAAVTLFGAMGPEQFVDKIPFDLFHPVDRAQAEARHEDALRGTSGPPTDLRILTFDGRTVWVESVVICCQDQDGPTVVTLMRDISERKREQAAPAERDERLRLALEVGRIGIWDWDIETNTATFSPLVREMLGVSPETDRFGLEEFMHAVMPEDRARLTEAINRSLKTKAEFIETYRILRPDGGVRTLCDRGRVCHDESGKPVRMMGAVTDVTAQIKAEAELRERDEQFDLLVEGIKDYAIIMLDPEGRVAGWNSGATRITGYEEPDIVGAPLDTFYPVENSRAGHPAWLLQQARVTGSVIDEGWEIRRDGAQFWADTIITALFDESKKLRGFAKTTRDLTEQKLTHDLISQSERRQRSLIETAGSAIIGFSMADHIVSWNKEAEQLFGLSKAEAIGRSFLELCIASEDRHNAERMIHLAREGEAVRGLECGLPVREGQARIVEWNINALQSDGGGTVGLIAVGRDITERKAAERQLQALNKRLASMASDLELVREEEQKRLARDLHDELGHQLTAVKLDVSLLEQLTQSRNDADRPVLDETIGRLRRALGGAIASVRKIARQARPSSLDRLGLIATLEALVGDVKEHAGLQARFISGFHEEHFSADKALEVALYRITQEALTNVVRHSEATSVEVRLREERGRIVLEIEDDGKGFDESRYSPDQSFGLRGMKERVEMVGGRFSIVGRQGRGTVVTVTANMPAGMPCRTS